MVRKRKKGREGPRGSSEAPFPSDVGDNDEARAPFRRAPATNDVHPAFLLPLTNTLYRPLSLSIAFSLTFF